MRHGALAHDGLRFRMRMSSWVSSSASIGILRFVFKNPSAPGSMPGTLRRGLARSPAGRRGARSFMMCCRGRRARRCHAVGSHGARRAALSGCLSFLAFIFSKYSDSALRVQYRSQYATIRCDSVPGRLPAGRMGARVFAPQRTRLIEEHLHEHDRPPLVHPAVRLDRLRAHDDGTRRLQGHP